jgi:hypothetical protein
MDSQVLFRAEDTSLTGLFSLLDKLAEMLILGMRNQYQLEKGDDLRHAKLEWTFYPSLI